MTFGAPGFGRSFPRAWLLPISLLTILLGLAVFGRFSRSIAADVIAWWPVWLGLGIAAYLLRDRSYAGFRFAGLVPLSALVFVLLFGWGHVAGWAIMPSSAGELIGPQVETTQSASLAAAVDGRLRLRGREMSDLYIVEPIRRGGAIGLPQAGERVSGGTVDVVLGEQADPGLYSYAGWDVTLSSGPAWHLVLSGAVDADLRDVVVQSIEVAGSGVVDLGQASGESEIVVSGSYRLIVPAASPVSVRGVAAVPGSWLLTNGGAVSPTPGEGWSIRVSPGSSVVIAER